MKTLVIAVLSFLSIVSAASAQVQCFTKRADASAAQPIGAFTPLTGLIEERLSLMTGVARAKWNTGSPIEDPDREQQLLIGVASQAQAVGIPPGWAQHFFRLQIEAAKEVQYCLFAQWAAQQRGVFQGVPDLKTEIRPKLDHLTSQLLSVLSKEWPALQRLGPSEMEKLSPQSGKAPALQLALLPLRDGSLQSEAVRPAMRSR